METSNLQIYWHESQPVYSLSFQEHKNANTLKLLTAGGDNKIRVWYLNLCSADQPVRKIDGIDYATSLTQHEQAVNVIRFNRQNDTLASAGDDGQLLLWKQTKDASKMQRKFGDEETPDEGDSDELWYVWKRLHTSMRSEMYDLSWSADGRYIAVATMGNSMKVLDTVTERCVAELQEHSHYVQGIVWDPQDEFILTQSSDRSVHVYKLQWGSEHELVNVKLQSKYIKCELPSIGANGDPDFSQLKMTYLFHNETLPSFFRRLTMSPCGSIALVPTGMAKVSSSGQNNVTKDIESTNCVYVYSRASILRDDNKPIMTIPFLKKPAIVVSFNPCYYKSSESATRMLDMPYKLVFAVATTNEVFVYDTDQFMPLAIIGNLHYAPLTDLAWSHDGKLIMVSSTDGFCSYIAIKDGFFGERLEKVPKLVNVIQCGKLGSGSLNDNADIKSGDGPDREHAKSIQSLVKKSNSSVKRTQIEAGTHE